MKYEDQRINTEDLELITKLVTNLDEEELLERIQSFVYSNPTVYEGMQVMEACKKGIASVARLFESGKYFVGDVIFAGELVTEILDMLKPIHEGQGVIEEKIVLGPIYGPCEKVGMNIFTKIVESAGFKVEQRDNLEMK